MALNVIALVSGGKDSFFSLLHCMAQGHRVVALANVYPADADADGKRGEDDDVGEDLNSFMYQTVGHEVLPLYAAATGLPMFREPIRGQAVHPGREYHHPSGDGQDVDEDEDEDEAESMTRLLRNVMAAHPDANAVCAGALLSTYQRTRVESVAVRLGLVSLAYLWKYTVLPGPLDYLADLAAAGFDARIIKVASAGLDDTLLWTNVADPAGRARLQRALQRLGLFHGTSSALGEGGEYETLVTDGPPCLFKAGRIVVADADRQTVHEGGGSAWLHIRKAELAAKEARLSVDTDPTTIVNQPRLLDAQFASVLAALRTVTASPLPPSPSEQVSLHEPPAPFSCAPGSLPVTTWRLIPDRSLQSPSIADAAQSIIDLARRRLSETLSATASPTRSVVRTLVLLRRMADFSVFNAIYGTLFSDAPIPPSRVAIACGDALPAGVDVAVFLTVLAADTQDWAARQGLHVQSRSYWAPANIGPYSQAVSVLAHAKSGKVEHNGGPRLVSIAGQIPLVPASMELPTEAVEAKEDGSAGSSASHSSPASFSFQTTLALQHLWRIGIDLSVQWWTGAVAYVPRELATPSSLPQKAQTVALAWRTAHLWRPNQEDDDDDDDDDDDTGEGGPDLWDRTFDARYVMYGGGCGGGGGGSQPETPPLPDWTVFPKRPSPQTAEAVSPVFLAEVQELPRSAPVEWHAQPAWSQVQPSQGSCIRCHGWTDDQAGTQVHQTLLLTTQSEDEQPHDSSDEEQSRAEREKQAVLQTWTAWTYQQDTVVTLSAEALANADMVYADMSVCQISDAPAAAPVVPCFSLWNGLGRRLAAVVMSTQYGTALA
ncbi:hypothetical protein SEPCBS119000_001054 [Sporothrix epigloea]|uniref:Diphthine--ammonia ligase n=1 Tax=Sporothrix epigloea TaxID=1892477 RepID=A0ABP0DA93_9PEZI